MKLSIETFKSMITTIRQVYGPSWRTDLETDTEAQITFFHVCQALMPEEMVSELITTYCTNKETGPRSPYDIISTYIEKQLENAKSSEFVIQMLALAIREYEFSENEMPFADCDDYIFQNVISILPCPDGVKNFYYRNKRTLNQLALYEPSQEEKSSIYKNLGFDYRKQLTTSERKAVIEKISYTALPEHNTIQLEA